MLLTRSYIRQPTSQSVPYCQQAPKNPELKGLFQCQFASADPNTFVGGLAIGKPGTIPPGHSAPLSPAGSCPANPQGPIADGTQLSDITQNPGAGDTTATNDQQDGGSNNSNSDSNNSSSNTSGDDDCEDDAQTATSSAVASVAATAVGATPSQSAASNNSSPSDNFKLQNGKDAQALNAKFASLNAKSTCSGTYV